MTREVFYEQSARDDLRSIFSWIADRAGSETALAYVNRIHERCDRLLTFPRQGRPRDDVLPGLRTIAFERSAIIAYFGEDDSVRVMRVLRKGRELVRDFDQSSSSS